MRQFLSILDILLYFAVLLGVVPILNLLGKSRKSLELKCLAPYLWLVCLGGILEMTNSICYSLNIALFQATSFFLLYNIVEFITLYIYFQAIFITKYRTFRRILLLLFILLLVYFAWNWQPDSIFVATSGISAVQTMLVLVCSVLWLRDRLNEEVETTFSSSAHFYVIIGFLIYYSCTFLLFVFDSYLNYKAVTASVYRWIAIPSAIILRLFLIAGVWIANKKTNRHAGV